MPKKNPATERALGARVRYARIAAKMSQGALGEQLGISFQQVQKYELGKDRISASMLLYIARCTERPISYFYEDMGEPGDHGPETNTALADIVDRRGRPRGETRHDIKILHLLQQIDGDVKRRFSALLEAIAGPSSIAAAPAPLQQAAE